MLKFMFMLLFLIPLCFMMNFWWVVQSLMFLMSFGFLFVSILFLGVGNLSYIFGCDILSFGLILLSF